ncbi:hypothetical protein GQR58_000290 [Nymphon striatum]|nr:hypothetical protein GQR58_000290 [Nymphon striatum]
MRHPILVSLCLAGSVLASACDKSGGNEVDRKLQGVNVVDETNLNEVMLTVADPNEAVTYFQRASQQNPERIDLMRGLAKSLIRAKRPVEAWERAENTLNNIPPTHETFKRYRLEAMIADGNKDWKRADSFYETAVGLTTTPANVMNNWGYSKLTRGDYDDAERLFVQAIRQDNKLFTAKNNLILARGAQGNYVLPVIPMSQIERAQLLHTLGLAAVKKGDIETGKGLFREAIDTHPQYFEAAVRSLRALEDNVTN